MSPSHLTKLYAAANAMPLNAKDATRGSPSPWNVFAITPAHAIKSVTRLDASVQDRDLDMSDRIVYMIDGDDRIISLLERSCFR